MKMHADTKEEFRDAWASYIARLKLLFFQANASTQEQDGIMNALSDLIARAAASQNLPE